MMIADDQIESDSLRVIGFGQGSDSTIHRHCQFHTLRLQFVERVGVESVAFVESVGDVFTHVGVQRREHLHHQRRRRHAVGVVVAVDGNRFTFGNGPLDPFHCLTHTHQPHRVIVGGRLRAEIRIRLHCGVNVSVEQQLADDGIVGGERAISIGRDSGRSQPAFGGSFRESHEGDYIPGRPGGA